MVKRKQPRNDVRPDQDADQDVQNDEIIGVALKYSLLVGGVVLLLGLSGFAVWKLTGDPVEATHETERIVPEKRSFAELELPNIPFANVTQEIGIDWEHETGMEGEKLLPETMGGGVAIFDFDNDGDQDLLLVGGRSWDWAKEPNPSPRSLALFANDGQGNFTDVTEEVGLDHQLYGMAPVVGDFDNDGWVDLYVTAVGKNRLFQNQAGKFVDVTETAGVGGSDAEWSTGATWFDYDNDGLLDLFVCDYVVWNREIDMSIGFSLTGVGRAYGQPTSFTGTHSKLYHNEGDGVFRDVSEEMGIHVTNANTGVPVGKGLAVVAVDVNEDGWTDLMVANDTVQNFLFLNFQGNGFEEAGVPMGVAYDRSGNATGAMGLDFSYFRNNDSLAISIGNFANEPSSLYVSRGPQSPFYEQGMTTGLGPLSRLNLTFGMFFVDLDLDGRQDLACVNGHLEEEISKIQSTQTYEQPPQFFWNAGSQAKTELVSLTAEQVGEEALQKMVGRGAAYGDLDGDGDLDIVFVENGGPPRVLRNDQQLGHHWLRLRLVGGRNSNRDAYGARVSLETPSGVRRRVVTATRSYISQCESVLTFGLGEETRVERLTIDWPDGETQTIEAPSENDSALAIDRQHEIQQE